MIGTTSELFKNTKGEKEMEKIEFKEANPMEEVKEEIPYEKRCITRKVAVTTLYELINSFILSDDLTDVLEEIAHNIEMEEIGYHFWGADREEKTKLFIAMEAESITPEYEAECERIDDKYSFVPSHFEQKEIEANICDYADEDE